MECARAACEMPISGEKHVAIWNEPSTSLPRLYCVRCGMRIIRGNERDEVRLRYEIREDKQQEPPA